MDNPKSSTAKQLPKMSRTIAERKESSIAACWNVYLILRRADADRDRTFNGRYEALAERDLYYNEDPDDSDIPDEINGVNVFGGEDESLQATRRDHGM